MRTFVDALLALSDFIVKLLSFEWLLTKTSRPNGGDIVFLRAVLVSIFVYLLSIGVKHGLDPARTTTFSGAELKEEVRTSLPLLGAIFAATYLALYSRFASQWTYLATLYNRIKETEVRAFGANGAPPRVLAQWKAGFLEDAEDLHLATKRTFAPVIVFWSQDPEVRRNFVEHTPGAQKRLDALLTRVNSACTRNARKYGEDFRVPIAAKSTPGAADGA